jgi:hypothetical protein
MSKHTPGPWRFALNDDGKPWLLNSGYAIVAFGAESSEDGGQICEVSVQSKPKRGEGWKHSCPVRDANARLIAAAPDLLEALQYVLSAHGEQLTDAFEQAHKAIAKATGAA